MEVLMGISTINRISTINGNLGIQPTPLKNDGVKVSWDDSILPIYGKIIQMFQTTNQV
jgi:hypothetical protein